MPWGQYPIGRCQAHEDFKAWLTAALCCALSFEMPTKPLNISEQVSRFPYSFSIRSIQGPVDMSRIAAFHHFHEFQFHRCSRLRISCCDRIWTEPNRHSDGLRLFWVLELGSLCHWWLSIRSHHWSVPRLKLYTRRFVVRSFIEHHPGSPRISTPWPLPVSLPTRRIHNNRTGWEQLQLWHVHIISFMSHDDMRSFDHRFWRHFGQRTEPGPSHLKQIQARWAVNYVLGLPGLLRSIGISELGSLGLSCLLHWGHGPNFCSYGKCGMKTYENEEGMIIMITPVCPCWLSFCQMASHRTWSLHVVLHSISMQDVPWMSRVC